MTPPTEWIHFDNTTIEVAQLTWVCVCVRTRLMKRFKLGDNSACLLAKHTIDSRWCVGKVVAWYYWKSKQHILNYHNHTFPDQGGNIDPQCFQNTDPERFQCIKKMNRSTRATFVHVFVTDFWWPLLLNRYILIVADQGGKIDPECFQCIKKMNKSNKSKMSTCLRAGLLMTPPTEWIQFDNTTIEVAQLAWVCVCVRTRFMNKLKFGDNSACLLATKWIPFEVMCG